MLDQRNMHVCKKWKDTDTIFGIFSMTYSERTAYELGKTNDCSEQTGRSINLRPKHIFEEYTGHELQNPRFPTVALRRDISAHMYVHTYLIVLGTGPMRPNPRTFSTFIGPASSINFPGWSWRWRGLFAFLPQLWQKRTKNKWNKDTPWRDSFELGVKIHNKTPSSSAKILTNTCLKPRVEVQRRDQNSKRRLMVLIYLKHSFVTTYSMPCKNK